MAYPLLEAREMHQRYNAHIEETNRQRLSAQATLHQAIQDQYPGRPITTVSQTPTTTRVVETSRLFNGPWNTTTDNPDDNEAPEVHVWNTTTPKPTRRKRPEGDNTTTLNITRHEQLRTLSTSLNANTTLHQKAQRWQTVYCPTTPTVQPLPHAQLPAPRTWPFDPVSAQTQLASIGCTPTRVEAKRNTRRTTSTEYTSHSAALADSLPHSHQTQVVYAETETRRITARTHRQYLRTEILATLAANPDRQAAIQEHMRFLVNAHYAHRASTTHITDPHTAQVEWTRLIGDPNFPLGELENKYLSAHTAHTAGEATATMATWNTTTGRIDLTIQTHNHRGIPAGSLPPTDITNHKGTRTFVLYEGGLRY